MSIFRFNYQKIWRRFFHISNFNIMIHDLTTYFIRFYHCYSFWAFSSLMRDNIFRLAGFFVTVFFFISLLNCKVLNMWKVTGLKINPPLVCGETVLVFAMEILYICIQMVSSKIQQTSQPKSKPHIKLNVSMCFHLDKNILTKSPLMNSPNTEESKSVKQKKTSNPQK